MTEAERARLIERWFREHDAEWGAYLAKPVAEREADQDKVEAAYRQHGVQAARDMSRALGRPSPPDEICDPVEELEAKRAAGEGSSDDVWMRESDGRVDH